MSFAVGEFFHCLIVGEIRLCSESCTPTTSKAYKPPSLAVRWQRRKKERIKTGAFPSSRKSKKVGPPNAKSASGSTLEGQTVRMRHGEYVFINIYMTRLNAREKTKNGSANDTKTNCTDASFLCVDRHPNTKDAKNSETRGAQDVEKYNRATR